MVKLLFSNFCHLWGRERYLSLSFTSNQSITFDRKIAPQAKIKYYTVHHSALVVEYSYFLHQMRMAIAPMPPAALI